MIQQPGKDMGICGDNIVSAFMQLGLIDEYRIIAGLTLFTWLG
jgi:hypothetical protein